MKGVFPISTGLVVQALAQPEWLMEIDVIAVIAVITKSQTKRPKP